MTINGRSPRSPRRPSPLVRVAATFLEHHMNHKSVEFLRDYNDWRREAGRYDADKMASIPEMPSPREVGESIDWACEQIERLRAENTKLKTVMIAAGEEISVHWEAHCDKDGYGPVNLLRRLEEGVPAEYGYTAGAFERLRVQRETILRALCDLYEICEVSLDSSYQAVTNAAAIIEEYVSTNQ